MAQRGTGKQHGAGERRRVSVTLILAAVSHAALLLIDVRSHEPLPNVPPNTTRDVEIELRQDEPVAGVPSPRTSLIPREEVGSRLLPRAPSPTGAEVQPRASGRGAAAPLAHGTPETEGERQTESPTQGLRAGPTLTPDQLGIGTANPFVARATTAAERGPELSRRVDRVLAEGIASADQVRGLGPEGPVLARLESETRNGLTPPNSSALFKVVTDGSGQLLGIDVIDANSDQRAWQEIGARVRARLQKQRLRGTHGKRGLTFEIRVISRVALPSGSDPGLAVDVLGIPVKKGQGKNSPRVSILDLVPKTTQQTVTLPDGRTVEVPMISLNILGIAGDPADIGAPARRMVHARLERLWAN